MPRAIGIVGLLSAMLVGCQTWQDGLLRDDTPSSEETIKICISTGDSLPHGSTTWSTWEFRPTGECSQSSATRYNAGDPPSAEEKLKWQSKTAYHRCAALLRLARFFQMQDKIPLGWCGGTNTSISVSMGQQSNNVSYRSFDSRPRGIARLIALLDECAKEAAVNTDQKK